MNVITGKPPIAKIKGFNGLWSRGGDYTCPQDHLTDCYNCIFPGDGQLSIRENFQVQNDIATRTIISFAVANLTVGPHLITLNSDGKLYDETSATLLGTFAGSDDFVCLSIFGNAYISLKASGRAYSGGHLKLLNGITLGFSDAGAAAPGSAVTLTQPNAGTVDPGVHTAWVCYQTATGYVTKPSASAVITSDGVHTISFSAIPTGPAGTVARVLLISRANETEAFFIPGGTINDNVTTTFEYTGFDSSLIASADYLFDNLNPVPSVAALKFYKGRVVLIGRDTAPDTILLSAISSPETFNLTTSVVNLPVEFGMNSSAGAMIIRDVLYITKPNGTYSAQDNSGDPNTWGVSIIDSGIGGYDTGISVFASSMSAQDTLDSCFIAGKTGLMFFNGSYSEIPFTHKIESIWQLIPTDSLWLVQVAHDIWNKRVYISVPLQPAGSIGQRITSTSNNALILMMDYQLGLDPNKVRWSAWKGISPIKKIAVENFTLAGYSGTPFIYQLAVCTGGTLIYKLLAGSASGLPDSGHSGATTAISQYIITAPISPGGIVMFSCLDMFFNSGVGTLTPALFNKSRVVGPTNQRTFTLDSYDLAFQLQRLINFTNEGIEISLSCNGITGGGFAHFFWVTEIDVYGTVMFNMRPALSESA